MVAFGGSRNSGVRGHLTGVGWRNMGGIGKSTFREIKSSFGRFMAIFAIIALGVGFFAGLKVTKKAMMSTVRNYLDVHAFYDFKLLSTMGFEQKDVDDFLKEPDVEAAEGSLSFDILYRLEDGNQGVAKTHSITGQVNTLKLVAGRMPENGRECVADSGFFGESAVGTILYLSEDNTEEDLAHFAAGEYEIVGLVQSPLYLQYERGNTSIGSGKADCFLFLDREGYDADYFTEIYVKFQEDFELYSEEYDSYVDERTGIWEELTASAADRRYREIVETAEEQLAEAGAFLSEEERLKLTEEISRIKKPETYVLGRNTNIGYACFENDSDIVEGIANLFPVFFFLVAALVCITTMNRMVEEQRTQIGVLKALGYGNGAVMSKYMVYSGMAAAAGCVCGFLLGTWGFPKVIWFCYGIMYRAAPVFYVFSWRLAVISVAVSLLCSMGAAWLSCRVELSEAAAELMRPKAPKAGKRVLLERISFLWKRLRFLHKVTVRNLFRYKKRLFMMVLGISGCTALLVTGFGIKDSIADVAEKQFGEIQVYDMGVSLKEEADSALEEQLAGLKTAGLGDYVCVMERNVDLVTKTGVKSTWLVAGMAEEMPDYVNFYTPGGERIAYPSLGQAVVSAKLAEDCGLKIGDRITLRDDEMRSITVTVAAIYENYLNHYVHISEDTWRELTGGEPERKTLYVKFAENEDENIVVYGDTPGEQQADSSGKTDGEKRYVSDGHTLAAELMKLDTVSNVTVNRDTMERIGNMMASLDIIVVVVILCAAGLAFIVLYNLTNINITERVREIATVKVLGFYKKETSAYVFRENIILTLMGMALGLVLGHFLHRVVMNEIRVDLITFDIYVRPLSYLYSSVLTMVFAWFVNWTMGGRLERISMTESLKSVD